MATRPLLFGLTAAAILAAATNVFAVSLNEIITQQAANSVGLTRAWITEVQLDRGKSRVQDLVLYEGILYVQTNRASIEAIDAETGQMIWSKLVGSSNHPSLTLTACRDLLATINGSQLLVLNRYTGDLLFQVKIEGAAGAGPGLSSKRAYVPLVTGMIKTFRIEPLTDPSKELGKFANQENMTDDEKLTAAKAAEEDRRQNIRVNQEYIPPLACQSSGRALVPPLPTYASNDEEFVAWTTDKGYLHVGYIDRRSEDLFNTKYRLETGAPITAKPAYLPPDPKVLGDSGTIFTGSEDGYVYALQERSGELLWKFSAAEAVVDSPMVIDNRVYVTTQLGGMFALDIKNGKLIWNAPGIVHFVASSKLRVYGLDKVGRLRILDSRNGSMLAMLDTETLPLFLANGRNDRIYLGTESGTLQCLRETELTKPIVFNEARWKAMLDEEMNKPVALPGKALGEKAAAPRKPKAPKAKDDAGDDAPPVKPKTKPAKGGKEKPADDSNPFGQ